MLRPYDAHRFSFPFLGIRVFFLLSHTTLFSNFSLSFRHLFVDYFYTISPKQEPEETLLDYEEVQEDKDDNAGAGAGAGKS